MHIDFLRYPKTPAGDAAMLDAICEKTVESARQCLAGHEPDEMQTRLSLNFFKTRFVVIGPRGNPILKPIATRVRCGEPAYLLQTMLDNRESRDRQRFRDERADFIAAVEIVRSKLEERRAEHAR